ncbi:MAG TPA: hypothetical protein VNY35_02635 [Solirubrobacteraceae bacterium]|nr:hypothetical protein [Solirubrobacteraceae bacterium]
MLAGMLSGCGGSGGNGTTSAGGPGRSASTASRPAASAPASASKTIAAAPVPPPPSYPVVLSAASRPVGPHFTPVVSWQRQTAVWMARLPSGLTLLYLNQGLVTLALHSGTIDAGASGWRHGPAVLDGERRRLVAAFNGGFKFETESGGFLSYGRTAVSLRRGLGSIVTYADGSTNIGAWEEGVPSHRSPVVSVRQNLSLLIDHGHATGTVECVSCWGATLGGGPDVARSALGITSDRQLVWAGGEGASVATLAEGLLAAKAVRAVELDINPQWVAAYLYRHRGSGRPLEPIPVVPAQNGIPGAFLEPYSRDFFTVLAR